MQTPIVLAALLLALSGYDAAAQSTGADPGLVEQGKYFAKAGDCAGCHGTSFSGGDAVPSPIGKIYASNITPDPATGIGSWTLSQFSDALRKGVTPDGYLYPAMPYTSYTGLNDHDIQALYSYFMLGVDPVSNTPRKTHLPFPFIRPAMAGWNALFLDEGQPTGAVAAKGDQQERGRLLVETLGHCSACHSPRGNLMEQNPERHLGGTMVGGWWAPNITPDPSGIGSWSNEQLSTFLKTGHNDLAVAAGEMGTVVSRSLSKLSQADIDAIIAYLRVVPPVASDSGETPRVVVANTVNVAAIEPAGRLDWRDLLGHDATRGDRLYQSACASCHGVDGKGSADLKYPSLRRINSVTGPGAATLVQVIAHGVDRTVGGVHTFMPAFQTSMSNSQIASTANYVRSEFGGIGGKLSASDVAMTLDGRITKPWIIQNAYWLAISAIIVLLLACVGVVWVIFRKFGSRPVPQVWSVSS